MGIITMSERKDADTQKLQDHKAAVAHLVQVLGPFVIEALRGKHTLLDPQYQINSRMMAEFLRAMGPKIYQDTPYPAQNAGNGGQKGASRSNKIHPNTIIQVVFVAL